MVSLGGSSMKDVNPQARVSRLIEERNFLGAQLFLKEAEIGEDERSELLGVLATAVVDELSRTRREDRERLAYLRSVLAWILREVPGLGGLYREQLREVSGSTDAFADLRRGLRSFGDMAAGRKSVSEGLSEASDEARRRFDDAAEQLRSGEPSEDVADFLSAAEKGIRGGLDQLSALFRAMNDEAETKTEGRSQGEDGRAAAKADSERDVEDADFSPEDGS